MRIWFDTLNLYYIPQYWPIYKLLQQRGHQVQCICYRNKNDVATFEDKLSQMGIHATWVNDEQDAKDLYLREKPDWIFFGNAFQCLEDIHQHSKTAQLGHGVGPKPSYYKKSDTPMTVRFMEGELRLAKIEQMYPNDKFVQVGFSKLDPLFDGTEQGINLAALGLEPSKKTIVYAPTFNPSSIEAFPDNWPTDFADYNILVKPHALSMTRERYKGQRKKLLKWAEFSNCHLAAIDEFSIVPYLKTGDILLSEASSTLFEFIAQDKPVVVCDFYHLKWSYRGPLKFRFDKRFRQDNVIYKDIGPHVDSYKKLKQAVEEQLTHPAQYQQQRTQYNVDHIGPTDGNSSERIVDYLESFKD